MEPPLITEEDMNIITLAVLLPIIMTTLEVDIALMDKMPLKMGVIHKANLRMLQTYITSDLRDVKKKMRERGIRIIEEGKVPNGYRAAYKCRGYENDITYMSEWLKSMIIVKLAEYMEIPLTELK